MTRPLTVADGAPQAEPLSEERLREIEARLKAATPGPWMDRQDMVQAGHIKGCGGRDGCAPACLLMVAVLYPVGLLVDNHADATFIAHCPDDTAALLAEVRRLQSILAGEQARADSGPVTVEAAE